MHVKVSPSSHHHDDFISGHLIALQAEFPLIKKARAFHSRFSFNGRRGGREENFSGIDKEGFYCVRVAMMKRKGIFIMAWKEKKLNAKSFFTPSQQREDFLKFRFFNNVKLLSYVTKKVLLPLLSLSFIVWEEKSKKMEKKKTEE